MKKVPMRDFDKMKTRDFSIHPHIIANSKSLCGYDEWFITHFLKLISIFLNKNNG